MTSNTFPLHLANDPRTPAAPLQPAGTHGSAPPGFEKAYDEVTTTRTRVRLCPGGFKRFVTSDSLRTFPDDDADPFRILIGADGRVTFEQVPRSANIGAQMAPAIVPEPRVTSARALQRNETLIAPQQAPAPQRALTPQHLVPQQLPETVRRMPAALVGRDEDDAMVVSLPTTPIPPLRITDDRAAIRFMRSCAADDFIAETRAAINTRIAAAAAAEDASGLPMDVPPPPPYTEGAGPSNNAAAPTNPHDIVRRRDERRLRTNQINARRAAAAVAASTSRRPLASTSRQASTSASTAEQDIEYIIVDD
ncbi:hypothetical protein HYPSUDRAFT_209086 [Hypholoma sublateritium FD-334 SS-4]|uniref:Uncharacterized protein n=1 Tax=Hypholoma sublateritium (strain FD-334 SS-4) TaxID=945553 RepID=A0A0D2KH94_HYPSF|nr:hypothetical protein HYPSUDRAFT_209086 [Hypholoma sublateritium FD-334 SS-4]